MTVYQPPKPKYRLGRLKRVSLAQIRSDHGGGSSETENVYAQTILATADLVAYWRLGEPSGGVATDSGPNGLDGAYQNSPTLGAIGAIADGDTAVQLDGSNDHVTVAHDAALSLGTELSIELWFKWDSSNPANYIPVFGKPLLESAAGDNYAVWFLKNGNGTVSFQFYWSTAGDFSQMYTTDISLTNGNWYHLVITTNGQDEGDIYLNGVAQSIVAFGPSLDLATTTNTGNLYIGQSIDGTGTYPALKGVLDEIAIYSRILTAGEVLTHYQAA